MKDGTPAVTARQDPVAAGGNAAASGKAQRDLRAFCRGHMAALGVPGVAVAVRTAGWRISFGEGVTNLDAPVEVTSDTAFQVGSLSKIATATALMHLIEQGHFDLDLPVRRLLPGLRLPDPAVESQLTMRDLLTHRTGWEGDVYEQHGRGGDALARAVNGIAKLEIAVPFRSIVSYNNANFYLLGRLVEILARQSFEDAVQTLVLRPADMGHSAFFLDELVSGRVAVGHMANSSGISVARPWMTNRSWNPTGGLISSAADMLRLACAHLDGGVISPETVRQMREPQFPALSIAPSVCLPWFLETIGGEAVYFHDGDVFTAQSLMVLVPGRDFALVVLSNSNHGSALNRRVRSWCLQNLLGLPMSSGDIQPGRCASVAEFEGIYRSRAHSYSVAARDDGLWVRFSHNPGVWPEFDPPGDSLSPFRVTPMQGDEFAVDTGHLQGRRMIFCRDVTGSIRWLHFFGRAATRRQDQPGQRTG